MAGPPFGSISPQSRYFNSRPYARGDPSVLYQVGTGKTKEHFNSRPYARGDIDKWATVSGGPAISIHAPTRGATRTLQTNP